MNIKEVILEKMKADGYTSICNPDIQCGCGIDDLFPCDNVDVENCQLGYTKPCVRDEVKCAGCDSETGDVCFTLEKPDLLK